MLISTRLNLAPSERRVSLHSRLRKEYKYLYSTVYRKYNYRYTNNIDNNYVPVLVQYTMVSYIRRILISHPRAGLQLSF